MMKRWDEQEWRLIYAAWCVRVGDVPYDDAIHMAYEAWGEGCESDPETIAELDLEA